MKTAEDYLKEVKAASDADWKARKFTMPEPEFHLERGSKYIRLVVTTNSVDVDGMEHLIEESFEDEEGEEFEICPECHEFILKTVMKEGVGKTLYETQVCSNPDCDNQ